jgi:predicted metal-dependent hydrolase
VSHYDPAYLRGIECFNRHEYFEAHEVWEGVWRQTPGEARLFYQGLIQGAVALYHLTNGNLHGAKKLYASCRTYLGPYRPSYLGLDVNEFLAQMARCFERLPETSQEPLAMPLEADRLPMIRLER